MSSTDLGDIGFAGNSGDIADKLSGDGLAGYQGQARWGWASGKARGGRQVSLEHIVAESRAGDRSIGARDSSEDRAGNRVSV
jgi:hypothetical protein